MTIESPPKPWHQTFRIATWNLGRPTRNRMGALEAKLTQIADVDAGMWVLTETDRSVQIGSDLGMSTAPPGDPGYLETEAYAAIHATQELRRLPFETFDPRFAVCVELPASPIGPLIVYGSIITNHHDGVATKEARPWEFHRKSVIAHASDWVERRRRYPNHTLVVAGDFNQALDGVGRYRDRQSTQLLWDAFAQADLRCLTATDFVAEDKLKARHSIDHIAISNHSAHDLEWLVTAWEGTNNTGQRLSDHNGVAVTLRRRGRWRCNDGSEVVLMTGVEGGGYTLYGERTLTGWRYHGDFVDQTPLMLDEPGIRRESEVTDSLDQALVLLGPRWHRLPAIRVHPEFRSRIWRVFEKRFQASGTNLTRDQKALTQWREKCTSRNPL